MQPLCTSRCSRLSTLSLLLAISAPNLALSEPKHTDIENIGVRNINQGQMNFMSLEKEMALGRQLALEVERNYKVLDDPIVSEYVNRLGQNLVRNSDATVPFVIRVLESDEINAMALPGGYFYINTGLLQAAGEEAELAGVMAHEIAHVAARHGTEQLSKGQLFNFLSIPLIFVGGPIGYGIRQAAGFLVPLQFLRFSRGSEHEADFLGLQYLHKSGYDPGAFITFFERLRAQEKKKPGLLAKAFSSHPPTGKRIAQSQENIQQYLPERSEYVLNTSEFDRVKARLAALENRSPLHSDSSRPVLKRKNHPNELNLPESDLGEGGPPKLKRNPSSNIDSREPDSPSNRH
ncbi:MAG: M48 family metallopeptidase [Acidobacteriota bacterium]